ncbi:MAG: hypothetical protein NZ961_02760 [Candidatus Poribacteria bacterium]|nr:hypothetical protein [Candidatus Poribacteria bacterium]|tara:strand:- start:637 stop:906 length:270 start_codon:yes stop_codon:yes gene_type:complete
MNADERYLFDLMGYVIIPDVLTAEEVKQCNQAIDHHIGQLREMPNSLAGGSEALAGTSHRKDMGGCYLGTVLGVNLFGSYWFILTFCRI